MRRFIITEVALDRILEMAQEAFMLGIMKKTRTPDSFLDSLVALGALEELPSQEDLPN